jgi:competence protein ComEC
MILYYASFGAIASGWIFKARSSAKRWALGGLAGLALWCATDQWRDSWETRLYTLPLSGGHAVFLDRPGNLMLVDCGNASPAESVTVPFLRAAGVNRLDGFCVSHASARQMGGAIYLLTNIPMDALFSSQARARSPNYKLLTAALESRSWKPTFVRDGTNALDWMVLHPGEVSSRTLVADDNAVVLQTSLNGTSVLLLSELSRAGQDALLERHPDLRADIVIAGLPTKDEPACQWLIETVKPRLVIIADGDVPAGRRASPRCRDRLLRNTQGRVLFCRDTGALTIIFTPSGWRIETADGRLVDLTPQPIPLETTSSPQSAMNDEE